MESGLRGSCSKLIISGALSATGLDLNAWHRLYLKDCVIAIRNYFRVTLCVDRANAVLPQFSYLQAPSTISYLIYQ